MLIIIHPDNVLNVKLLFVLLIVTVSQNGMILTSLEEGKGGIKVLTKSLKVLMRSLKVLMRPLG